MCPDCYNAYEMLSESRSFKGHNVTPVKELKAVDYDALRESFVHGSSTRN